MKPDMIGEIKAVQDELGIDSDGNAGPQTWAAVYAKIVGASPATADQPGPQSPPAATGGLDARSERNILSLHPKVQPYARPHWPGKQRKQGFSGDSSAARGV